eukprot:CAMPEP_0118971006 /NCGR_PEP_ID=MMETSP1173-20130426/7771_1 /TAXON_ID=1034831 /ORGANISM="Rhizochromulina marina cf, Strain CCMP1243" /LENGTH=217 /DNA_ID=CAMNT_0006920431 /DNA_START=30 /DNA_END=683 /DNA_ORIENTATION=+
MAKAGDWTKQLDKVVDWLYSRTDSLPFREPVQWRELGLDDYPLIIKQPMSLKDVKEKLAAGQYRSPNECAEDIRLIWKNCMQYNQDGSDFFKLAQRFSARFEDKFSKLKFEVVVPEPADDAPPTLDEKTKFAHNIYRIKSEELGEVVIKLDQSCPSALDKKPDKDEIEINIDNIEPRTFHLLDKMVKDFLPEGNKKNKKKKAGDSVGGGGKKQKQSE